MRAKDETSALFWCHLLHDVLFGDLDRTEERRVLQELAESSVRFPDGSFKTPSLSTLKRKLRTYRKHGFDALPRKPRSDRGTPRNERAKLIERAIEIKRDQPKRSHRTINRFLKREFGKTLPKSTLYRHLKKAGATRLKLGVTKKRVRKRWTKNHTHALWVGDFEHGPYVLYQGKPVPTRLSLFIDCYSRFVVEARYYFRENLDVLCDSMVRAVSINGPPEGVYVDNAKVYHANAFTAFCYRLDIRKLHREELDPAGGGVVERMFETIQDNFEAEVRAGQILTLEELNQAFAAWLAVLYHQEVHSETNETPKERFQKGLRGRRSVDLEIALQSFHKSETRTVHADFSDVQLNGRFFRVDKKLRKDKVDVRYDPFAELDTIRIYSLEDGRYLGKGTLHHRETGEQVSVPPPTPPRFNFLKLLEEEHQKQIQKNVQGIDFRNIPNGIESFADFLQVFGRFLGRKGVSDFTSGEIEHLQRLFQRQTAPITEDRIRQAVAEANGEGVLSIASTLKRLLGAPNGKEK